MESQPQNPEFRINPENLHPYINSHLYGPRPKLVFGVRVQHRCRTACTPTQSDQHLCYSFIGKYHI